MQFFFSVYLTHFTQFCSLAGTVGLLLFSLMKIEHFLIQHDIDLTKNKDFYIIIEKVILFLIILRAILDIEINVECYICRWESETIVMFKGG